MFSTLTLIISRKSRVFSLVLMVLTSVPPVARSQAFTDRQTNAYIAARNWDAAFKYTMAWMKAEPNNSHPWGALGITYGMGFHQPANAISASSSYVLIGLSAGTRWESNT